MYYKIITPKSYFADLYADIDIFNISYGSVFVAPEKSNFPFFQLHAIKEDVFHFSNGAFDAMLWHTVFCHQGEPCQIYKIEPIGNILTYRHYPIGLDLDQCGATSIKFLEKQNIDSMYEYAIKEYYTNPKKYINFIIDIDLWKRHQPTVFALTR